MPRIELHTQIHAPIERVFDLARSIDLHAASLSHSNEIPVAGTTTGLIGLEETVTWRARHFCFYWQLTSRITIVQPPQRFQDCQLSGPFAHFTHDHYFTHQNDVTTMVDQFDFASPLGILGAAVDKMILTRYMTRLLQIRNLHLKQTAESEQWGLYLFKPSSWSPGTRPY